MMYKSKILLKTSTFVSRTMSTTPNVLFETINNAGIITLNRPKILNTVNISMLSKVLSQMREWETSRKLVIIKGAGDKAFCPGGDVKQAIDKVEGPQIFNAEYNANYYINKYKIPYVALIHGITMGGGLGLSVHGRYRVATENTIIAMPENKIGLFPDAGGSYFLPRLKNNLGIYMGLTGHRLKAKDAVSVGVATHFISSVHLNELEKSLSKCTGHHDVQNLLDKYKEPLEEFSLQPYIKDINYCFAAPSVEKIIHRLEKIKNDWSLETINTLRQMCPSSLKITLKALQHGAQMELAECLKMEYRIVCHSIESYNFPEGVRALIIDKDNKPQWQPSTIEEVDNKDIDSFFQKLPEDKELKFFDADQ